ncbi:hypothetical protein EVAR_80332_1 [Eumeta japonica]|uniref:Uncharacterized protein n=1 Tax=Eumeta variegata TaxID=151549 RepID=A0A4C1WYY6_EUMVA|nr:hypothetical protein EVAR_80332_1 [Eumeta japonica]
MTWRSAPQPAHTAVLRILRHAARLFILKVLCCDELGAADVTVQFMRYHILTEYGREVTASTVAFRPRVADSETRTRSDTRNAVRPVLIRQLAVLRTRAVLGTRRSRSGDSQQYDACSGRAAKASRASASAAAAAAKDAPGIGKNMCPNEKRERVPPESRWSSPPMDTRNLGADTSTLPTSLKEMGYLMKLIDSGGNELTEGEISGWQTLSRPLRTSARRGRRPVVAEGALRGTEHAVISLIIYYIDQFASYRSRPKSTLSTTEPPET